MLRLYESLLYLYPADHREQFGGEMMAVIREAQAETAQNGVAARGRFCAREVAGLLAGALQEHLRTLVGAKILLANPNGRLTMRNGFRFPKSTAVLMTMILAGVVWAIEKGKAIQASLPDVNPHIGPIQPSHLTILPAVALAFLFFYAAGLVGWSILFALRRSGVHRLAEMSEEQK